MGNHAADVCEGAKSAGLHPENIVAAATHDAAAEAVARVWRKDDIVLVKRSRGSQMERVVEAIAAMGGLVLFTVVDQQLREILIKGCANAKLPVVPGAEAEIAVPLPDDDMRLEAEARLASMREELVDVVARRNILMARARHKIEQKDFDAAQELIRAVDQLPGQSQFNLTLSTASRLLRSDDPQIQRRIDQLFQATQTVLGQYLDARPISDLRAELREAQRE